MQLLFTTEELELDYPTIFGVSCGLKMEKLAYYLLGHSDIEVERLDDVTTYNKKSLHEVCRVDYLDDDTALWLIRNRGTGGYFYPSYKKVDYLLCSTHEEEINEELIRIVSELRDVSICFALKEPNQTEILNFSQLL